MRRIFYLFLTVLFISCSENSSDTYKVEGNAYGYEDGTPVYLYEIDANNQSQIMDTLEITSGTFSGTYTKEEDTALKFFRMGPSTTNILFFTENEDIKATIYKDSLEASVISGGKQNELYYEYQKETLSSAKKRIELTKAFNQARLEQDGIMVNEYRAELMTLDGKDKQYKRNFVKENGNSVFGLMLLSELFNKQEISANEVNDILAGLSPKLAANPLASELKATVEARKKAEIGGIAPQFSAPTPDGEMLSLQDAMGKYTIIDFWASWCRPCRIENPNVVKVYNKYHDKGLNIISVSLDKTGQRDRWLKAIADDNMDWFHVSNLKFWQDPIARQYNVRSIPATFLLDETGKIIDKNLRGPALEARISSLLD